MCSYPKCNYGRCVSKKFCPKHLKTPFCTQEEVNAYRRGLRVAGVYRKALEDIVAWQKDRPYPNRDEHSMNIAGAALKAAG
jgi:hypothetical protein